MESPKAKKRHPFNVRYWTALTWLGIIAWLFDPILLNYPPSEAHSLGVDGKLVVENYASLAEVPFPVGWPYHYVTQRQPFMMPIPAIPAPVVPLPAAPPSLVNWETFGLNVFLIALATVALIYCSQKLFAKFSIATMMVVMLLIALYFTAMPWLATALGYQWGLYVSNFFYFSPVLGVILIKAFKVWESETTDAMRRIAKLFRRSEPSLETPDDLLSTASKWDHMGNWDEAIRLYREAAQQWPEQANYAENCIAAIELKKSTAG